MPKGLECIHNYVCGSHGRLIHDFVVSNALLGSGSPRLDASVKTLRTIYFNH